MLTLWTVYHVFKFPFFGEEHTGETPHRDVSTRGHYRTCLLKTIRKTTPRGQDPITSDLRAGTS